MMTAGRVQGVHTATLDLVGGMIDNMGMCQEFIVMLLVGNRRRGDIGWKRLGKDTMHFVLLRFKGRDMLTHLRMILEACVDFEAPQAIKRIHYR
jgi:hypothetical protein